MKNKKKKNILKIEYRNALYNKTIKHNQELALSNSTMSVKINKLENAIKKANQRFWYKPWLFLIKPIQID